MEVVVFGVERNGTDWNYEVKTRNCFSESGTVVNTPISQLRDVRNLSRMGSHTFVRHFPALHEVI